MEEVEDLPIETTYNLIHSNIMSLEEFEEWIEHEVKIAFMDGLKAGKYESDDYWNP